MIRRSEDEREDLRHRLRTAEETIHRLKGQLQRAEGELQQARDGLAQRTRRLAADMAQRRLLATELTNQARLGSTVNSPVGPFERERARVDRPTSSGGIPHHRDGRHNQPSRETSGSSRHERPSTRVPSTRASATHSIVPNRRGDTRLRADARDIVLRIVM